MKANLLDVSLYRTYLEENTKLAGSTVKMYTAYVQTFLGDGPDVDVLDDYNSYLLKHAIKKSCHTIYYALQYWLDYKIEDSKLRRQIKESMIIPEQKDDLVYQRRKLSDDELIDIINHIDGERYRMIAVIQTLTGSRVGDLLKLKEDGVSVEEVGGITAIRLVLHGAKGGKGLNLFLYDTTAQLLFMEYLRNHSPFKGHVFLVEYNYDSQSKRRDDLSELRWNEYIYYWRKLKVAIGQCGYNKEDFASHDFRRHFAWRAWAKYKDLYILKRVMNHERIETSLHYLKHSGQDVTDYAKELQS